MKRAMVMVCTVLFCTGMVLASGPAPTPVNWTNATVSSDAANLTAAKAVAVEKPAYQPSTRRAHAAGARTGGETCATATVIPGMPYTDNGCTAYSIDDYDAVCPYTGSTSPDVVYAYAPTVDVEVNITLCVGITNYDTKLYVYENACDAGTEIACNDDSCSSPYFSNYVSSLTAVPMYAGSTYYIVVDGYGGASGDYTIECTTGACVECTPNEGEPDCYDEYVDATNGGCNSSPWVFQQIQCGQTICGTSGTYLFGGSSYRDTDWFEMTTTSGYDLYWTVEAMFPLQIFIIQGAGPADCSSYSIVASASGGACTEVTASLLSAVPGTYWFWVAPSVFSGVPCGTLYTATLECLEVELRGACCDDESGICEDDVLAADCTGRFALNTLCDNMSPPCGGCIDCDPNEGEPICEDEYVDVTNGGCNSSPWVFQQVECGQTICGTSGTYLFGGSSYRDTDWFEITTDGYYDLYWDVEAEFPLLVFIIQGAGPSDCSSYTILGSLSVAECQPANLAAYAAAPGTYWFWVGPSVFTGVPCGSLYTATLTCVPYVVRGACCDDATGICQDDVLFEDCTGRFAQDTLCDNMVPPCGGCPEDTFTLELFTDNYPSETTWDVKDLGGNIICSGGPYSGAATTYFEYCCLAADGCYIFTIYDAFGDGICCSYGNGYYIAYLNDDVVASGGEFDSSEASVPFGGGCGSIVGRCCYDPWPACQDLEPDACDALGGDWTYGVTCASDPCPEPCVNCEPNEGEPICEPDYDDMYNGGCNSSPWVFQPIACDQTICGTSGTYLYGGSSYRDTDWFELTTTGYNDFLWDVKAEFPLQIFIIKGAGPSDCSSYSIVASMSAAECTEIIAEAYMQAPGTYWFWVGPSVFSGVDCGARYQATLTCIPLEIRGACCDDNTATCEEDVLLENCAGRFAMNTACADMVPPCGGCPEDTFTLELFTDNYPSETTWDVKDGGGNIICSGGPYAEAGMTYFEYCCLDADGCYTFTIYDAYGDGICCSYGNGYYIAYMNDDIVASGGEFGTQEASMPFGGGCGEIEGRCCYEASPICGDLNNDFCLYEADFWLFVNAFGTCLEPYDPKYNPAADFDGDNCITLVDYQAWLACWFEYGNTCGGPGCSDVTQDACDMLGGDWTYGLNCTDNPCPPACTVDENEPDCYDEYVDETNGGCNSSPDYPFGAIACGDTLCGASGTYLFGGSSYRDTDWFAFSVTEPTNVTFNGLSTFGAYMFILSYACPDASVLAQVQLTPGVEGSVSMLIDPASGLNYALWVGPSSFTGVPCGSEYKVWMTCAPAGTSQPPINAIHADLSNVRTAAKGNLPAPRAQLTNAASASQGQAPRMSPSSR